MKVMVVSPHPDDETLGAGGTVLRLIAQGDSVSWLNVTNMKQEYGYTPERIEQRTAEIDKVKKMTGYCAFYDLGLEPAGLEKYPKSEIIAPMKKVFDTEKPEVVILPFPYDAHSDHKIVYECGIACTKAFRSPYIKRVLCMDILSETNYGSEPFKPNYYVDIEGYLERKIQIVSCYESEIKEPPFPRSQEAIRAQALYRGSSCYRMYAEAFHLVKEIL